MAAYRRVYDSRHLQADCQEPGSAPVIEYGLPLLLLTYSDAYLRIDGKVVDGGDQETGGECLQGLSLGV